MNRLFLLLALPLTVACGKPKQIKLTKPFVITFKDGKRYTLTDAKGEQVIFWDNMDKYSIGDTIK